jgi:hypothetical protein
MTERVRKMMENITPPIGWSLKMVSGANNA